MKTIKSVNLTPDDTLDIHFTDGTGLRFRDNGQNCCEKRYMVTDDNLNEYEGAEYLGWTVKDAPSIPSEYDHDHHEIQFLEIATSKGPITLANHNEHNGYYGGFWIEVEDLV